MHILKNDNMIFKFKEPQDKTKKVMCDVLTNGTEIDYEKKVTNLINEFTGHHEVNLTNSGNGSIFIALASCGENIIIPDQGAWNGFKQIAKFLGKNIITLKTEEGIIREDDLNDIKEKGSLILTSFAGYSGEQDMKMISEICKDKEIKVIEDASAGIGDKKQNVGNGEYSNIIISSTGSPKIINVGNGGIISTNDCEIFKNTLVPQKITKTNEIIASGIYEELKNAPSHLEDTFNAVSYLKNNLDDVIHAEKRGLNVIIRDSNPKDLSWNLRQELTTTTKGFITTCPNYNRVKEKGVAIEIKNLDYNCLKKENLDYIIEIVEKYRN